MKVGLIAFILSLASADPLACQPNVEQPMLPIYHIIGNVTFKPGGRIRVESINDCSGITYYEGLYHVWHQCCQDHWDHMISKDLIHWQRLPPPIQPLGLKTWDGSINMLPKEDGGPMILYDAQDGKLQVGAGDKQILGVAHLADINDKYLLKWKRADNNPVEFKGSPTDFPGQVWKNGDHWNFLGRGARFQSNDTTFHTWTRMNNMIGGNEHGGQWWIPMPSAIDGSPPPRGFPDHLVNVNGGQRYLFGHYHPANETFTPWSPEGEKPGKVAILDSGAANWCAGQMASGRMMTICWVPGSKGLTLLREANYDAKTQSVVSNPLPELQRLRNSSLARERDIALKPHAAYVINGTEGGAASSADVIVRFSGITTSEPVSFGACVLGNSSLEGLGIAITVSSSTSTPAARRIAGIEVGTCGGTMFKQINTSFVPGGGSTIDLFDEEAVTLRITPDRSLADFFVQGGRWAGTVAWSSRSLVPRKAVDSQVALWSASSGVKADANVYSMGCGWADPSYTENPTMLFDEQLI